ncbi:hypothetical protein GCM10010210_03120 [Pseudonocardia hydrocarbonoxydans]
MARFLDQWMELPRSKRRARVRAGMDVLVLEPIDDCTPQTAFDVLERLEKRLRHYYERCCVPFSETTLAGRRVTHLEALPALSGNENRSVEEFLPASPSTEDRVVARLDPVEDERLLTLMVGLSPTERAVMLTWGAGRMSWQQAALTCQLPESDGERVRAKLMRRARVLRRVAPGGLAGGLR